MDRKIEKRLNGIALEGTRMNIIWLHQISPYFVKPEGFLDRTAKDSHYPNFNINVPKIIDFRGTTLPWCRKGTRGLRDIIKMFF